MGEIVLNSTADRYIPDYSTGSVITNINSSVAPSTSSSLSSLPPINYEDANQPRYNAYPDFSAYQQLPLTYPVSYSTSRFGYVDQQAHPTSPGRNSPSTSQQTPPTTTTTTTTTTVTTTASNETSFSTQVLTTEALEQTANASQMITPLVPSSTFTNATTERVKETIARANTVPMEFYQTEFLEYSKESYEKRLDAKRNKRKRPMLSPSSSTSTSSSSSSSSSSSNTSLSDNVFGNKKKRNNDSDQGDSDDDQEDDETHENSQATNAEIRRQIHIQSEQKRRAQIKNGFDELRKHLPGCNSKKMSKAALLTRTVQQIQHLKNMQAELLAEVERLVQENETLKKFQYGVLQRQAMEKMYTF